MEVCEWVVVEVASARAITSAIERLVRACSLRYRSESTACSNDANLS